MELMYDRSEFLDSLRRVHGSDQVLCVGFQRDLSALLDGELPERPARRALAHLESCTGCSEFFQAIRLQALAHRDLTVPGSLARRMRRLRGEDLFEGLTDTEIIRRVARVCYELGKAYVLLANGGDYLLEVAEEPVQIDTFQEGEAAETLRAVEATGACQVDAETLRSRSGDYLQHGRRLLGEALRLKPNYSEARLYSGFVHQLLEDFEGAAQEYRMVFLHSERPANRAHAAIQLGQIQDHLGNHAGALRVFRWVVASGLLHRRPEFSFVLFNIAVQHLALGDLEAGVGMLRRIRLGHPELWVQCRDWLRQSPRLLAFLSTDQAFRSEIESTEPAFFAA